MSDKKFNVTIIYRSVDGSIAEKIWWRLKGFRLVMETIEKLISSEMRSDSDIQKLEIKEDR